MPSEADFLYNQKTNDEIPRARNSKSLGKETKMDNLIQTRQKWSHICQKLSALVTVQQDYTHITSDNKKF